MTDRFGAVGSPVALLLVACALVAAARHVTGIDLTPAMIDPASARQQAKGLTNLMWLIGGLLPLPLADRAFFAVVTRFSFHHLLDPPGSAGRDGPGLSARRPRRGDRCFHFFAGPGGGLRPG